MRRLATGARRSRIVSVRRGPALPSR
jgi:hypothetical protein